MTARNVFLENPGLLADFAAGIMTENISPLLRSYL